MKRMIQQPKEYDYDLDLNWRDDGDELADPCMNDYLKGYQLEPYAFQQWSKLHKSNKKTAAQEVINMHYHPEFLADYILTLWNGIDGSLQDFYEGFTLRYNNNLKKAIAEQIKEKGYTVYPVLTDDRAFYAKRLKNIMRLATKANLKTKLAVAKKAFGNSEALKLCFGEIDDIEEMGSNLSEARVSNLLDYYQEIFPQDYAVELTTDLMNNKIEDVAPEHYQDFGISNEGLTNMEKMLCENQDPYDAPYEGGTNGWDYISDMRGFDGVKPEQFEVPVAHASLKKND